MQLPLPNLPHDPRHPAWLAPALCSSDGDDTRAALGWHEADAHRRRVADALRGGLVLRTEATTTEDGRRRLAVRRVALHGAALDVDGRELREDWIADPERAAAALDGCGATWGLHLSASGQWGEHPHACSCAICPACVRRRAAARSEAWAPVLGTLAQQGYRLVLLTLTQPQRPGSTEEPCVLTDEEAARTSQARADGGGRSTPGEPIAASLDRLTDAWRLLRDGAASRAWWRASVAGGWYGLESTGGHWACDDCGRDWSGPSQVCPCGQGIAARSWRLRWHTHLHALVVLRPEVRVSVETIHRAGRPVRRLRGRWWTELRERWHELTGGAFVAQDAQLVESEADAVDAVSEVLKYPVKLGELTDAQLVDWLASTKGRHWHGRTGALHPSSVVGALARWAARQGPEVVDRRCDAIEHAAQLDEDPGVWEELGDVSRAVQRIEADALCDLGPRWAGLDEDRKQLVRPVARALACLHREHAPEVAYRDLGPQEYPGPRAARAQLVGELDGRPVEPVTRSDLAAWLAEDPHAPRQLWLWGRESRAWSVVADTAARIVWALSAPPSERRALASSTPGGIPDTGGCDTAAPGCGIAPAQGPAGADPPPTPGPEGLEGGLHARRPPLS